MPCPLCAVPGADLEHLWETHGDETPAVLDDALAALDVAVPARPAVAA
jgi:hypothetical protein